MVPLVLVAPRTAVPEKPLKAVVVLTVLAASMVAITRLLVIAFEVEMLATPGFAAYPATSRYLPLPDRLRLPSTCLLYTSRCV